MGEGGPAAGRAKSTKLVSLGPATRAGTPIDRPDARLRAAPATRGVLPKLISRRSCSSRLTCLSRLSRFDEGRQASADQPEGARADTARFGRIDGWKSRYRRRGGVEIRGPLVIESRADLFKSSGGAEEELNEVAREQAVEPSDRGIGDEAVVVSTTQAGFPRPLRTFVVYWRTANVVGAITANGFQGRVSEKDALRLARRQQARIAAADRLSR